MLTVSDNHIVLGGGGGGGGDVVGATSSTDNALVRWDGATGKAVQNSKILVADSGALTVASTAQIFLDASRAGDGNLEFRLINNNPARYTSFNFGEIYGSKQGSIYYIGSGYPTGIPRYQPNSLTMEVLTPNGKLNLLYPSTGSLNVYTNTNNLVVKADNLGNIGINTDSPTAKLDVNGSLRVRGALIDNAGSSGADGQVLKKVGCLVLWANP